MNNKSTWPPFSKTKTISAPASEVWKALTEPELIKKWLLDEELEVMAEWKVGGSVTIKGAAHWVYFETKGLVLQVEPEKLLRYQQMNSLSNLPDVESSYSVLEFKLEELIGQTVLTLQISNFPTESIYRHLVFYWNTTLDVIRSFVEGGNNAANLSISSG